MANEKRRVIGLVRLSTDEQAKEGKGGLLRQRADIKRICDSYNFELVRVEEVVDVSGCDTLHHPVFGRIFKDLAKPDIAGAVASAVDRFVRPEMYGDLAVFDYFKENGKKIWTSSEGELDPSSDMGFLTMLILGGKAGIERREIARRVAGSKEGLRREGRQTCNPDRCVPRGVRYLKGAKGEVGVWGYVEPWASRVRLAFDLLLGGVALCEIARRCGYYGPSNVREVLANPIWIGIRRYVWKLTGKFRYSKTGRKYRPRGRRDAPLDVPIPNLREAPLVSPETFAAAQQRLLEIGQSWIKSKTGESEHFLAKGVLRCACGQVLYTWTCTRNGHNYDRYFCSSQKKQRRGIEYCGLKAIRRDVLDPIVEKLIGRHLSSPALLIETMNAWRKRSKPAISIETTAAKLKKVRERLDRAYEFAMEGKISKEQYAREKEAGEAQARELEALIEKTPAEVQNERKLAQAVAHAFAEFSFWPLAKKQALVRRAVKQIVVEDRGLLSLTISGGFLGELAVQNSALPLQYSTRVLNSPPDLLIQFKEPIPIQ